MTAYDYDAHNSVNDMLWKQITDAEDAATEREDEEMLAWRGSKHRPRIGMFGPTFCDLCGVAVHRHP